jgi:Mn-dependent DtxR family transcriptional regulator
MTTENRVPLIIKIPFKILSSSELSLNDKLILGLDYTFSSKNGSNTMNNKQVSELFHLHTNIVGDCRKRLVAQGYLSKDKQIYFLTSKFEDFLPQLEDERTIYIPSLIYRHPKLRTGEKLLWGEYNSMSEGVKAYFASREYTAKRLDVSKESITNWTNSLEQKKLITILYNIGYCTHLRLITTCKFDL